MSKPKPAPKLSIDDFAGWAKRLRGRVQKAKERELRHQSLRPIETADGVHRTNCYSYFRRLERAGKLDDLAEYVKNRDPGKWHRHPGSGIVWVLRLIDKPRQPVLSPNIRSRMAIELNWAAACKISPNKLLGFLHESGSHELIKAVSDRGAVPDWCEPYQ